MKGTLRNFWAPSWRRERPRRGKFLLFDAVLPVAGTACQFKNLSEQALEGQKFRSVNEMDIFQCEFKMAKQFPYFIIQGWSIPGYPLLSSKPENAHQARKRIQAQSVKLKYPPAFLVKRPSRRQVGQVWNQWGA